MRNHLILVSSSFPFGIREVFLENEILYLSKRFDSIVIIAINNNTSINTKRELPSNCTAESLNIKIKTQHKIIALKNIFSYYIIKEITTLKLCKLIKIKILSTIFISYYKAKLIKTEIEKKINLVDNYYLYSYWGNDGAIAIGLIDKVNTKRFCRVHGSDLYFEANDLNFLPFRKTIFKKLNAIFTISQKGKEYIKDNWKIKTNVIVNRLGVEKLHDNSTTLFHSKKNTTNEFIVVSCSNLIPLKRLDLLIESLSLITEYNIKWVHFGDGIEEIRLKEKAKQKLPANIKVEWKGRVTNKQVLEYYNSEKPYLFINVSTTEGVPVSIMEAMSYGIPCIATNVGGTNEIVSNKNGALMNCNPTIFELSNKLVFFLKLDKNEYDKFSLNAKLTWENNFCSMKNYNKFIDNIFNL